MKLAAVQLNATADLAHNLDRAEALIREAAAAGAEMIGTPEVTNMIAPDKDALFEAIEIEAEDLSLARLRALADELSITLLIGSLALRAAPDQRLAVNRGFLIGPGGRVRARYDKIHMFEANLGDKGTFREADSYQPGERAVLADIGEFTLGMTICYDLRFPHLYRQLAQSGASLLSVPSAFTAPTGQAHWHVLLRARAIENGAYVVAPAQWGPHGGQDSSSLRESYGHSLIIDPWGEVLADAGEGEGFVIADLDPQAVIKARARIPSLSNDRSYGLPG